MSQNLVIILMAGVIAFSICFALFFIYALFQLKKILTLFISTEDTAQDVIYKIGIELEDDVNIDELQTREPNDNGQIFVSSKEVIATAIRDIKEEMSSMKTIMKYLVCALAVFMLTAFIIKDMNIDYWSNADVAKTIITKMYTTPAEDMEDTWVTMKPHIDEKAQYMINMTKFENIVQRHQGINSKDTSIDFTFNKAEDNTLLVYYTIHTPIKNASYNRLAKITFNERNKITDFKEYDIDSTEEVVKYF